MKFDGKAFASEIEVEVSTSLRQGYGGRRRPKIVSVLVGDDPASVLYTKLKKQAAERVGIEFEIVKFESGFSRDQNQDLGSRIRQIGAREDVTGVMVQLPLPGVSRKDTEAILQAIPLEKDVDGLRYPDSGVVPPVVKAVLSIVEEIDREKFTIYNLQFTNTWEKRFVVLGARGFVGSALCSELNKRGIIVDQVDSDTSDPAEITSQADVVISCMGNEGMVTSDMVRDGAIVIDVGAPRGDMTREVYEKASVSVEVPGGIGPVTIACLLQNACDTIPGL